MLHAGHLAAFLWLAALGVPDSEAVAHVLWLDDQGAPTARWAGLLRLAAEHWHLARVEVVALGIGRLAAELVWGIPATTMALIGDLRRVNACATYSWIRRPRRCGTHAP